MLVLEDHVKLASWIQIHIERIVSRDFRPLPEVDSAVSMIPLRKIFFLLQVIRVFMLEPQRTLAVRFTQSWIWFHYVFFNMRGF
jgi:hypothetical protein